MLVAVLLFMIAHICFVIPQWQEIAHLTRSIDLTPFLGSWSELLLYALIGGIVGPIATTVSAFAIYCGLSFRCARSGESFFNFFAADRRGGFGLLGTLVVRSTFMAAVLPGVAIPILFIGSRTESEVAINAGLIFFLIICIALFFFVPVYYVHTAMRISRKRLVQELKNLYQPQVDGFLKETKEGQKSRTNETASLLLLGRTYDSISMASDWPIDFIAVLQVVVSAVLPVLAEYLLRYVL
jgi:hypothetical protein